MEKFTHAAGKLAIFTGALSLLLTLAFLIRHLPLLVLFSVLSGLLGFITSNVFIFLNMRYQVSEKKLNPGTIGILLSSAPILLMLIVKVLHRS